MSPGSLIFVWPVAAGIGLVLSVVMGCVALAGFGNALVHKNEAYTAAGKLNKLAWAGILFVCTVVIFLLRDPRSIFSVVAVIPTLLYWVDVRPAVRGIARGSSSSSW